MMSDGEEPPPPGPRLYRLSSWFDPEAAAVVTILLGLFQVALSVPLAYVEKTMPKLFILPLVLGILIVAGGSFTLANEKNPSRLLLRGCACSNVAGLLGALLAFCLYCFTLSREYSEEPCFQAMFFHEIASYRCPGELLAAYCSSVILLLLLYDSSAAILHCLLSVSAFKTLKTD